MLRPRDTLTDRERHIINRVTLGWTNAQIAFQDGISEQNIKNRMVIIYNKVGLDTRQELAIWNMQRIIRANRMCRSWRLSRGEMNA